MGLADRPGARDTLVLGFRQDSTPLWSLSGADGRLLDRWRMSVGYIGGSDVDRERRVLVAAMSKRSLAEGGELLLAFSVPDLKLLWRERMEAIQDRSDLDVDFNFLGERVVLGPRGRTVVICAVSSEAEEIGLVVLDRESRSPLAFLGGYSREDVNFDVVRGPPGSGGLLVASGARDDSTVRTLIYELGTLTVRDSLPVGPSLERQDDLRSARDGRHVYM